MKGQSGNPGGRPKADPEVQAILKAATPKAALKLVELIDCENPKIALQACCQVLDRTQGKPEVISKLEVTDGEPRKIIIKWQD